MNQLSSDRKQRLGSSFNHPAAIGTKVRTKIERGDRYSAPEIYDLDITVLQSVRGEEAMVRLKNDAALKEKKKPGFDYILAHLQIGIYSKGRGFGRSVQPYVIEKEFFGLASDNGQLIEDVSVINSRFEGQLIGMSLTPGKTCEGSIAFQVPSVESNPLIVFKRDYRLNTYGEWPAIWFCI